MRRLAAIFLVALIAIGGLFWMPLETLLDEPRNTEARRAMRLGQRLARDQGVVALFTFDDAAARDWISGAQGLLSGTVCVPARFGKGRKFDGRERTCIDWPIAWNRLGSAYTVALWLQIDQRAQDQEIFYSAGEGLRTGFRLVGGALTFDVPVVERCAVSYPFERYGEFVHVAATVDAAAQTVVLYENGRERARTGLTSVNWSIAANLAAGKPMWYARGHPFRGILDDTALWNRALSAQEIRTLAAARRSLLKTLAPSGLYAKWRWSLLQVGMLGAVEQVRDMVGLQALRALRRPDAALPEIRLIMSGEDRRHAVFAHQRSRLSGRRTQGAANPRSIHVTHGGRVYPARLFLHGDDTRYADTPRPAYVVEFAEGAHVLGCRRLLLQPPERTGFLMPFVTSALSRRFGVPAPADGLCRLRINSRDVGVYRFVDHGRQGVVPGDLAGIADGMGRQRRDWRALFRVREPERYKWLAAVRAWPLSRDDLFALYDALQAELGPLLLADPNSPLSVRDLRRRFAEGRDRLEAQWPCAPAGASVASKAAAFLDEYMVLGSNASPYRVVEALDLDAPHLPGVTVSWASSHPAVLSAEGRVTRPTEGGPVGVSLTATLSDGQETCAKTFAFRVMPLSIALPTLLVYLDSPVVKTRRVDAVIEVCEQGEDRPSAMLTATQGARGGIHHRGNSSYWYRKKLLAIKTDTPHHLFGDDDRRILKTINALQDSSFVLNGLAYGLFRDFGEPDAPRHAPFVRPAEVFVNGRYHGLFELCTRVDETLLGVTVSEDEEAFPFIVYRHETLPPRDPFMRAAHPPPRDQGDLMAPYRELSAALADDDPARRLAMLQRHLDIASVIDLQLLLNLMQNGNGVPYNFPAHDVLVYWRDERARFVQVPWDFDYALGHDWAWAANFMMRDLEANDPGYRRRLAARWFALRAGVLNEAELRRRVQALAAPLAGYVEWDQQRWPYRDTRPHAVRLDEIDRILQRNLFFMDGYLTAWGDE